MSVAKRSLLSRSQLSIVDLKGISFKVIVIGESGVGKTTLIHKYLHGEFLNDYNITVGVDFKSKTVQLQDRFIQLQIWDTCGQEIYKSVISSFYRGASAVFLVYDVSKRRTFESLDMWNGNFDKEGSDLALKFLIGTKCDLERQVSIEEAEEYMKKIKGSFFIETSSLKGQNIDKLFEKAAQALFKHYEGDMAFRRLVKPDSDTIIIQEKASVIIEDEGQSSKIPIKKKKKCCSS